MAAYVGTSGWNYPHWRGVFYPEGLKSKDWLSFYVGRLPTLELNVTFYRQVKPETFRKWHEAAPEGFRFSVKMSRFITHIKRLRVGKDSVERFLEGVRLLGEKLGAVLIQLPPSLQWDERLFNGFCDLLDPRFRYTMEARHPSLAAEPFFGLLKERNMAWCISETAGRFPYAEAITADFVYMRLHGRHALYASSYTDEELREIAAKIKGWDREAYVYFDNDVAGYAAQNALALAGMVGEQPRR